MSEMMWNVEAKLLGMKDAAYEKIEFGECKTLKDFLDLGFNATHIVGEQNCYWKALDGVYEGDNYDPDDDLLATPVWFDSYDTDGDGYEIIYVRRQTDEKAN